MSALFEQVEVRDAQRLLSSREGGLLPHEKVVDLFCGAGGWGEGARELGIGVDFAVNHWPVAIDTHKANNPGTKHHMGDAWRARPRDVVGKSTIGLLLASAACTTHSRARGSAPISKRVHMLGWCISRWMKEVRPRLVEIENVPEWKDWGPTVLRPDGKGGTLRVQDPARKGQHFRRWWRFCERLGYRMEMRVLDAPDFGAGSRRKRLFIKARRDGMPIVWPERTHGKGETVGADDPDQLRGGRRRHGGGRKDGRGALRGTGGRVDGGRILTPFVTAADCIDWNDLGTSIFERKRALKPKTLARIAEGIRRFVLNDPAPFVLRVSQPHGPGGGWHVYPVDGSMPTQTGRQDVAMGVPMVAQLCQHGSNGKCVSRADENLGTMTTAQEYGLATPIAVTTGYGERWGQAARVHKVGELLGTSVDGIKQAVVTPICVGAGGSGYAGKPTRLDGFMGTVKPDDRHGLVCTVVAPQNSGVFGQRVDKTGPTITTKGHQAVYAPVMTYMRHGGGQHSDMREPLAATMAGGTHAMMVAALMMEYYSSGSGKTLSRPDKPMGAATTLDRHGLVCCLIDGVEFVIVDILFRMLRPRELAKAMGFRDDYVWPKTQRDTVRLIGNAVSPRQARANIAASLPLGRIRRSA